VIREVPGVCVPAGGDHIPSGLETNAINLHQRQNELAPPVISDTIPADIEE